MENKILIVEDNFLLRESLKDLLEVTGYNCLQAMNGAEALDIIQNEKPKVVISDINMPIMDGFKLRAKVNQTMKIDEIPYWIFLSARIDDKSRADGKNLGADHYLFKPYQLECLVDILRSKSPLSDERLSTSHR